MTSQGVRVGAAVDDVVDGDDVRVIDPGQATGLAQHPGTQGTEALRVLVRPLRPHLFEGHVAVEHQVTGAPHGARTATAEPFQQLEASVDNACVRHLTGPSVMACRATWVIRVRC
ncbi:hypothetical protein ACFYT5_34950 [Streptomyces anulatus]|uniref:hypothetical protein n=1 Tax=Streptomyces anulatus TaxID=1892 RepID=UPI0036C5D5BB